MSSMTKSQTWVEVGRALQRRRAQMGYPTRKGWSTRVARPGLSERTIADLENGVRDNYDEVTIALAEEAYRLAGNSLRRSLETGVLRPKAANAPISEAAAQPEENGSGEAEGFPEITWTEEGASRFYTLTRHVPGHRMPQTVGHSMPKDWPLARVKAELEQLADYALFLQQRPKR
ncbi:hypothetical protein GCM10027294_25290 [Marinactinospora endophytica]